MDSLRFIFFCIFSYNIFLHLSSQTIAQPDFSHQFCSNDVGNYTRDTIFRRNLNDLLSNLNSNIQIDYGFYNISHGESGPDQVNAIALCRGDIGADDCRSCVRNSTITMLQSCPNQKQVIGVYDTCMLRYSNKSIFGVTEYYPQFWAWNIQNASDVLQFNQGLQTLMNRLREAAASGDSLQKFATGNISAGFNTIYGLVQCTPDLSEGQCDNCLAWEFQEITTCCGGKYGARITSPSCNLRYEVYKFFGVTPSIPQFPSPQSPLTEGKKRRIWKVVLAATIPTVVVASLIVFYIIYFRRKSENGIDAENSNIILLRELTESDSVSLEELPFMDLQTIKVATGNFSDSNKLGQGGFGPVYKGILSDGKEVAVKRLSSLSSQGVKEFKNEVLLILKLQHKNLVRLLNFCIDGIEKVLVYEFMPNSSLDVILFDPKKRAQLNWSRRIDIVNGIAKGMLYLHEDSRLKIIHRDLKASNVLLDNDMNPKISDFGMARIFASNEGEANTARIVGTYGYMAPEYAMEGLYSIKSDVYSFGILLLEIISGKKNSGFSKSNCAPSLVAYAWQLWNEGNVQELMDASLSDSCSSDDFLHYMHIGLLCVQEDAGDRPAMSSVVLMLKSQISILPQPKRPVFVSRFPEHQQVNASNTSSTVEVSLSDFGPR